MKLVPFTALLLLSACFSHHAAATPGDLAVTAAVAAQSQRPAISSFTKGMQQQQGYFDFYYDEHTDKVYLKVDKLNQPFIFQSSLPRGVGSNDIGLDRGQLGETRLVQF